MSADGAIVASIPRDGDDIFDSSRPNLAGEHGYHFIGSGMSPVNIVADKDDGCAQLLPGVDNGPWDDQGAMGIDAVLAEARTAYRPAQRELAASWLGASLSVIRVSLVVSLPFVSWWKQRGTLLRRARGKTGRRPIPARGEEIQAAKRPAYGDEGANQQSDDNGGNCHQSIRNSSAGVFPPERIVSQDKTERNTYRKGDKDRKGRCLYPRGYNVRTLLMS